MLVRPREPKKPSNFHCSKTVKACNRFSGEILESPALDACKSRKTKARKDKDVADATTDNPLNSFQIVHNYYSEEE